MDNYDLVLEYLLSEGYSHKEATRIMVDENWLQNLGDRVKNIASGVVNTAKKRTSSLPNILRAGAADSAAFAVTTTPANAVKPAVPPQPAAIVRSVAAPVTPNPLQQVAAPFKKVRNIVRQLNPAKPAAGSLPQGKPGGSVVTASKPGSVTPSAKPASGISNASGSSSVATRGSAGQVTPSGASVRTSGGPLAKAGPVVDVQSRLSGAKSVQRLSPGQVRNFRPSVTLTGGGGGAGPLTGLKGGVAGSVISLAAQPVIDDLAKRGAKATWRTIAALRGKTEKAQQMVPSLYDKQGPDLTANIVSGVKNREKPEVSGVGPLTRVAAPYTPPRPAATKTPEKKPEVQKVVTKKKVDTPVVKRPEPAKPVDPRLQKYRELIRQGRHDTARDLGRQIHADKFGIPTTPTRKTA